MEATSSSGVGSPESYLDYSIGFDDPNFSDRTLLLEIIDEPETKPDPDDKVLEKAIAMTATPRLKTIHISSLILAVRSPFFLKLFSNGMRESEQRQVTLQIEAQEEVSFMHLLNYVYSSKLPTTLFPLLDLLKTADKFEVASCLRDCSRSLQNLPMTCELASRCLDLPPSLLTSHTIKPLIEAAKQFLVAHFKDVERSMEEVLNLPLASIQVIISSDELWVASEGAVYDLVLMWAHKHYPDWEERRGILRTHLLDLIRFPLMTTSKLVEEVKTCSDIDPELRSKIVISALHFKSETPHRQRCLAAEKDSTASRQYVDRVYKFRPIKVVDLELPDQQCATVYLDLKREEVKHIFPDGRISSETFHLGGQELALGGKVYLDSKTNAHCFWLSLVMQQVAGSSAHTVDFDIAVRRKPSRKFENHWKGSHTFTQGEERFKYLSFGVAWTVFLADDSPFFINDILHVRADLTMNK